MEDCTACQKCERACPVSVSDQYQFGLVGRKAAYIPFSICNPKAAVIDIENCTLCGACEKATLRPIASTLPWKRNSTTCMLRAVVLATGFNLFDPLKMPRYGFGTYKKRTYLHADGTPR